ncbi:MAG: hypothetical protein NTW51_01030 [Cyanobacteria bacterium]|nr:hypothetical protein [Cyanobacteriota bacterium]
MQRQPEPVARGGVGVPGELPNSGNEIDFSPVRVPTEAGSGLTMPIESKWVDHGWRRDALVLEGRYGRGVMATKSIVDLEHPSWAIQTPLVACLLG